MASSSRSRTSSSSPTADVRFDDSFDSQGRVRSGGSEFGQDASTLDLDHISDEELDHFIFEDEIESDSIFNGPTIAGLALILVGIVYLLAEMGLWTGFMLPDFMELLPWLAGVFVILLGFGLLSRGRSETREAAAQAPDADASEARSTSASGTSTDSSRTGSSWKDKINPFASGSSRKRLARSTREKKVMGVCAGIADYFNLDPTLVRIAFVIGVIASGGPLILAYLGLGWAMPKDTDVSAQERLRIIRES
jgi:phage shock protein C